MNTYMVKLREETYENGNLRMLGGENIINITNNYQIPMKRQEIY